MNYPIIMQVVFCLFLGCCAVTDMLFQKIWLPAILVTIPIVLVCVIQIGEGAGTHVICGILWGAVFLGMSVATRGQIEKGDGMVLGIAGLVLGVWRSIAFLFFSFAYAFLAALFFVAVKRKKKSYRMPFVPFALAGYVTLLLLEGLREF